MATRLDVNSPNGKSAQSLIIHRHRQGSRWIALCRNFASRHTSLFPLCIKQARKKNISPVCKISSQWRISVGALYRPEKSLQYYLTVCRKRPVFYLVISVYILKSQALNEASLHSLKFGEVPTLPTSVVGLFSTGSKGMRFFFFPSTFSPSASLQQNSTRKNELLSFLL